MKYIIILIDGVADYRVAELGNKTPLQYAKTPAMDSLAGNSEMGMVKTIPDGMAPGSDTANLSVLGYDPKKYHTGRSSLEAVSLGINLSEDDVAFRCNLVTLSEEDDYIDRIMVDYSAGEIPTDLSRVLIEDIGSKLQTEKIKFYPGVSYRHIIVWEGGPDNNILTPPHDILDKKISDYLPGGPGSSALLDMMVRSSSLLKEQAINKERIKKGARPANSIWIWGEGRKPSLDSFYEKYKLEGSVISAVDLIKGIGILAGLEPVEVKGATGTIHTNFRGKASAAINELKGEKDFVYLHLEAPDECSHQGNVRDKVKAIEIIDREVIKPIKEALDSSDMDYRMMILPDHYTPISRRTHTSEPVPFLIYDSRIRADNKLERFNEFSAKETGLYFKEGYRLADYFFGKKAKLKNY
ncbi:MAG: cofactor-independent phosphoglycerate mutase [Actinobacteria bacterium]|nr:cofactor-independent phosphoglycerate mutase [Actinomycetota bacterium]